MRAQAAPARALAPAEGDGASSEAALARRVERCLTLLRLFVEEVEAKAPDDASMRLRRHGHAGRGSQMRISVTLVGGAKSPREFLAFCTAQVRDRGLGYGYG